MQNNSNFIKTTKTNKPQNGKPQGSDKPQRGKLWQRTCKRENAQHWS